MIGICHKDVFTFVDIVYLILKSMDALPKLSKFYQSLNEETFLSQMHVTSDVFSHIPCWGMVMSLGFDVFTTLAQVCYEYITLTVNLQSAYKALRHVSIL